MLTGRSGGYRISDERGRLEGSEVMGRGIRSSPGGDAGTQKPRVFYEGRKRERPAVETGTIAS